MCNPNIRHRRKRGFTLLEILVVLGIIVVLAALTIPVFNSISGGANLSGAAESIKGELDLARQQAMTMNGVVEVRFYQLVDSAYNGYAAYLLKDDGTAGNPIGKVRKFPNEVAILEGENFSSLISDAPESGTAELPGYGNVGYKAFRFRSTGSADLGTPSGGGGWNVTLVAGIHAGAAALPDNYAMLTVIPMTGTCRIDRP